MAVCNVFKKLEKDTGTFLMFSQYVEDITRESTQSCYYHVTPSKFIALDIDYNNFDNETLVLFLQNYFENGCAISRSKYVDKWTPELSKNLFWNTLLESGDKSLLTRDNNGIVNEIKYIGDINLQSYNEHDGMGYSEIYCYIPSEGKTMVHSILNNSDKKSDKEVSIESGDYIEGYSEKDFDNKYWGAINPHLVYTPFKKYLYSWEDDDVYKKETADTSFKINTIIVLYDVTTKTNTVNAHEVTYRNIPLGIYFTGKLDNYVMTNSITKYISNPDIYNTGTSYGLRICSRFTVTPNQDNIKTVEITSNDEDYSTISQLLSQMSVSQTKMDEVISNIYNKAQNEKNFLATFKNNKTNIPYVKSINGEKYWFVNGKPVAGLTDGLEECGCEPYDEQTIRDMLKGTISLTIDLNTLYNGSNIVNLYDVYEILSENNRSEIIVDIDWNIKYKNVTVPATDVELLTINGAEHSPNKNNPDTDELAIGKITDVIDVSNILKTTSYKYTAEVFYDDMKSETTSELYLCYPSYIGVAYESDIAKEGTVKYIQNHLNRFAQPHKSKSYTYDSESKPNGETQHIIYAYPKSYGTLSSISDGEYEYLTDFKGEPLTFSFELNGVTKKLDYYVYIDVIPASVKNYTLKFN